MSIDQRQLENGPRILPFEGVLNFRDMGGYETADGRKVKHGLFFRSAELTGMTEQDKALFASLGIRTIIDYRSDNEAEQKPSPALEGAANVRVPAIKHDVQADMRELIKDDYFSKMTLETFTRMYTEMAIGNPAYKQLFEAIADPGRRGVLHHCAGGRDRTGVGSSFILLALGVPKETIIADYLLSNELLLPMFDKMADQLKDVLGAEKAAEIARNMALQPAFLEAVFAKLEETYGSVDAFFAEEFGLTAERLAQLRDECLA
ncbi:tyrosine-protein phosphatase [Paenibacillus methanolicus]|uniref:Protein-tyrosine phosphatase n=1 Tax=Paenibacillus methanolicus TaxID=582686 RepID=A0A5S5BYL7_9BACL|nr:tyrosine-protein phosphatase [Paenibacillus methanolicus]TYP72039.1 protein-tyrosine phosphatase [Paenibacillus methanolicus]